MKSFLQVSSDQSRIKKNCFYTDTICTHLNV